LICNKADAIIPEIADVDLIKQAGGVGPSQLLEMLSKWHLNRLVLGLRTLFLP
jgi:hypothetical protein